MTWMPRFWIAVNRWGWLGFRGLCRRGFLRVTFRRRPRRCLLGPREWRWNACPLDRLRNHWREVLRRFARRLQFGAGLARLLEVPTFVGRLVRLRGGRGDVARIGRARGLRVDR